MREVRIISSKLEIEQACALLYQVYIEKIKWNFKGDNPSNIRVEISDNKKILIDRFTYNSTWFGVFENNKILACMNVRGVDENNKLELEAYKSSEIVHQYIPLKKDKCVELSKYAILPGHASDGLVKSLFIEVLSFCEQSGFSIVGCTHNNFLKNFFLKINFPLLRQSAFKYEDSDVEAVNFYFADHAKMEVINMIDKLKHNNKAPRSVSEIFDALELIAPVLPTLVYWHDKNGVVLGLNEICLKAMGSTMNIIGKSPREFYPPETADLILNHNRKVIDTESILSQEEVINDITTGKTKYFLSVKSPLYDEEGTVIGVIGTSIDISAEKENELLKLENKKLEIENTFNNKLIMEQNNFKKIIDQAVHDIRSPLASLLIIAKNASGLSQDVAEIIAKSTERISSIANDLLSNYEPNRDKQGIDLSLSNRKSNFQVSLALQEIISEKKYEFHQSKVEFEIKINPAGYLYFFYGDEVLVKRMISNLINNAIEAIKHEFGVIRINLDVSELSVKISIEDNGEGMPTKIIDMINNNIAVTSQKKQGHGLGLSQVRESLKHNDGCLEIDSELGRGTKILLTFTKNQQPSWIVEKIEINTDDIVVILDDDLSVHQSWKMRFNDKPPRIKTDYFLSARDAMKHINNMSDQQKKNVLLLADYELSNQNINGLEVIEKTGIKRSLLVTNRFSNQEIQNRIQKANIKMMSKIQISDIDLVYL